MDEELEEFMIPKEAMDRLNDPELLHRYIEEGKTFQDILEYSGQTMDGFYAIARYLFEQKRYKEASDAFIFLTTLNPFISNYWLGLGMCEEVNEEYKQALAAYSMVVMSEAEQPLAYYQSAACYYKLGDTKSALGSLDKAIAACGENEEFFSLKREAIRSQNILREKH